MRPRINAYCLDWHINQSKAFDELLVDPLKPIVDVGLVAWDGRSADPLGNDWTERVLAEPVIFCQRPPTQEILEIEGARLVWIPMWDNVAQNWSSEQWWASLPKSLRVVAFSEQVACKSEAAGLTTLRLRFHKNPAEFDLAKWKHGRTLFYWNRTGLFGPAFIKKLCAALDIRDLYFRGTVDPKITLQAAYDLPSKIGRTVVHAVSRSDTQKEYFELLKRSNIYLAPRASEGVGLTFLEALASGCAVLGYDAATMNEYITHGLSGYLFPAISMVRETNSFYQRVKNTFQTWRTGEPDGYLFRVSDRQNWDQLQQIDLEAMGQIARSAQEAGFALWQEQVSDYARFVLDW